MKVSGQGIRKRETPQQRKDRKVRNPPDLFFFLRIALAIVSFTFHINFRIICANSVKNVMGNLIGIKLNLLI